MAADSPASAQPSILTASCVTHFELSTFPWVEKVIHA